MTHNQEPQSMRIADYVMSRLAALQVRQVFFLPGGGAMHLNDALRLHPQLDPVLCLHEQAAGIAAEAAGKLTGGAAACLVTSGPGATNVVTATLGAWLDSTPVFFVSGQVKSADLKTGTELRMLGVQEADIVSIVTPITKLAVTLRDPRAVAEVFDRLEQAALTGRRGPVWLDIPLDVQAMTVEPATLRRAPWIDAQTGSTSPAGASAPVAASEPAPQLIESAQRALSMLAQAKRPVIIGGNGIRIAGATDAFRAFFERTGVPVLTSWLGFDLIEDDHRLYAGRPGSIAPRWANFALQNADFVLVLGCRLDMAMTAYAHERFAPKAVKVMVDIDAAEIAKMKMDIELPVVADVRAFLAASLAQLDGLRLPAFDRWIEQIADWKVRYPLLGAEQRTQSGPVSMYEFSDALSTLMAEGDVIAPASSGFCCELFLLNLRIKRDQRCFHNRGTGAMGFGLPSAIGACVASGNRRTICVDGDGGLQLNVQELATLAARKLPVKLFIINNAGYASIRSSQGAYFQNLIGADSTSGLLLPDLEKLATAYGVPFQRITSSADMNDRIDAVLSCNGPVLCEVSVLPEEPRVPRVTTRRLENGALESSPLEDLFPFLERAEFDRNMATPLWAMPSATRG
jgi:acetolactate synthase-1/2/3 large subunit